jgi:hypothetical protein
LNPFDARIMSAWFAGAAAWAITMYFMKDWVEVKIGVRALLFLLAGWLIVWLIGSTRYPLNDTEIAARQGWVYGIALVVMVAWLLYAYWKQEQAHKNIPAAVTLQ